jgi:hypothetical protein
MLPILLPLGSIVREELTRLLIHAWQTARPDIAKVLADPSGTVSRIGETLVWSGPTGQKVLGGLEMLADSQARIDSAVNGIETAQFAIQGTLGVVQTLSMATLGITSLSAAYMVFRLVALNRRIGTLVIKLSLMH